MAGREIHISHQHLKHCIYPDLTKRDLLKALTDYQGLILKYRLFENRKQLLCLDGTVPIKYKNREYNIPLCIWVLENYPHSAPLCHVKPTTEMKICVSEHVDLNGKIVNIPYLINWTHDSSELVGLIRAMIAVFEQHTPVCMKPKSSSMPSKDDNQFPVNQSMKLYHNFNRTKRDVKDALAIYSGVTAKWDSFVFNNGDTKKLLSLDGVIPVNYKGNCYYIPICVWLNKTYPREAPMCFVRPTSEMVIVVSRDVDLSGKINLSYLRHWNSDSSNLAGLYRHLINTFEKCMPLYTKSRNRLSAERVSNPSTPNSQTIEPLSREDSKILSGTANDSQNESENKWERSCEICAENSINAVFQPCGHAHYCYDCSERVFNMKSCCCICRQKIVGIQKIFLP